MGNFEITECGARNAAARCEHRKVIAGHIASDVLGLNLLLDEVEKEGRLETIPVSGFERIRRKKLAG